MILPKNFFFFFKNKIFEVCFRKFLFILLKNKSDYHYPGSTEKITLENIIFK